MDLVKIKEDIYRYAIKNAFEHEGKADIGAVVSKIIALHPDVKTVMKDVMQLVIVGVKQVNAMKAPDIESEFKKFESSYELKPKPERQGLKKLADLGIELSEVVTRFAPNPNAPFHLGNARAAILSYEYAKANDGKFILRFEDTDPKIKKPIKDAERIFKEDLKWLGIVPDETYFQSDRLEIYYEIIRKLILMDKVYVCKCDVEEWRAKTHDSQECKCRELSKEEHMQRFDAMLSNELKQGQAVVRMKTDLYHQDLSVRDYWIARAIDNPEHERQGSKYFVWPAYNLASAVDDHEMGVTLIMRGQEHAQNEVKQRFMYKYLGWNYPKAIHFGRLKLEGIILSKSRINEGIANGEFSGYDDPRLGTIRALRRRGFQPEALKKLIEDVGTNTNDATVQSSKIESLNKKIIDEKADRFMFVENPTELDISFTPAKIVEFPLHQDFPERGSRVYELSEGSQKFFVSKNDLDKLKQGQIFRLRHAYNVKLTERGDFVSHAQCIGDTQMKESIFWAIETTNVEIVMPDNKKIYGVAEKLLEEKEIGDIVQFEKLGYLRIDSKGKQISLVLTQH
ncbi:MAG: glutamate--tRNA ligase [Candidatus Diapherotrites archaeon]|nr:glutamate--tRNA ligase [Candidatus Diapherotrites archaeon]